MSERFPPLQPSSPPVPASLPMPPPVTPRAAEARRKKRQSIPFGEMAALNDELARIERQLEELRGVQDSSHLLGSSSKAEGVGVEEAAALEMMDPMVQAMINVELCELAASGGTEEMRILLESGADPNTRDYDARSLLHIAAMNGHVAVVDTLLSFGADPTQIDGHGKTAAEYAEAKGLSGVAMLLAGHQGAYHSPTAGGVPTDADSVPSSTTSQGAPDFSNIPQPMIGSLVVIMVGLPGRGKTYISRQICRYFQWNGLPASLFSAKALKDEWKRLNIPKKESRTVVEITQRVLKFITQSGGVAIIDGPHESPSERQAILRELLKTGRIKMNRIIFVEVITHNPDIVRQNILRARDHIQPEDGEAFVEDYYRSIAKCEARYKTLNPITDVDLSYIRMEDSAVYSLNQISGWMPSRLAFMLHNLNHQPNPVYLARSGEYVDLYYGRIGGNSSLTVRGMAFTKALFDYFKKEIGPDEYLHVLSSCATRSTQTAAPFSNIARLDEEIARRHTEERAAKQALEAQKQQAKEVEGGQSHSNDNANEDDDDNNTNNNNNSNSGNAIEKDCPAGHSAAPPEDPERPFHCRVVYFPTLDDINHGDCEGMLISDVKQTMPYTIQEMRADPYYTAWPNGECLHQVFNARLEPHIHDIQASAAPVLVISHLPLLQGLHSYFVSPDGSDNVNPQNAYKIKIPLECVIKIHVVRGERVAEVVNLSSAVDEILAQQQEQQQHSSP